MRGSTTLRKMLEGPEIIVLPGAYDALSARLAEQAGFDAVFTTGFGFAAAALGAPDYGLMTMSEIMERTRHITRAVSIPLVADMDTGYGNELNVIRTIQECVEAGVAGVILEDQQWPKKCGHFDGKRVIPAEDHASKLKAAVHARGSDDLVIIARTDSRAPLGFDEAVRRGNLYRDAGADVVFVEAPQSMEELSGIVAKVPDAPLFANMIEGGKTPFLSSAELQALGFKMVVYPLSALFTAARSIGNVYRALKEEKTTARLQEGMVSFSDFENVVGVPHYKEIERKFAADGAG